MSDERPSDQIVADLRKLAMREQVLEPWFDDLDAELCRKAADLIERLTPRSESRRLNDRYNLAMSINSRRIKRAIGDE